MLFQLDSIPVFYAFAAGMIATINPCGFVMLPAYVAYQLGFNQGDRVSVGLTLRAYRMGLIATLGFVVLFLTIGVIISVGGNWMVSVFPYGGFFIGISMICLGIWLLVRNKPFGLVAASRIGNPSHKGPVGVFLFGIAYGVASLSCSLPIFLVVVGSAVSRGNFLLGIVQFLSYSLGMGIILILVTIGVLFFKGTVNKFGAKVIPHLETVGALSLVISGAYLAYYWIAVGNMFGNAQPF